MLVKMPNLVRFQLYAGKKQFFAIFGEKAHKYWDLYKNQCNQNIIDFYERLYPIDDRGKLIEGINKF